MILPITAYGMDILRQKTVPTENNEVTKQLIADMLETLAQIPSGVGLAANQVNSNLSVFLARLGNKMVVHINPIIIKRRGAQKSEEGCLSIPKIFTELNKRDDIIEVISYDQNFNKQKLKLRGFDSVVFQHEYEHLLGILFIDHMTKEGREEIKDKLSEIESGKIQTHYPMIFKNSIH